MPKRPRTGSQRQSLQISDSVDDVDTDNTGHTPKWTRSSASASASASASPSPSLPPSQLSSDRDNKIVDQHMQCILPGHPPMTLASAAEFEIHYAKEHNNQCLECRADLPSAWMLDLHQSENHDPLIAARRDQGEKMYRCFVQDCEKVTLTPQKRRLHLIDKHGYPRDYDFRIVDSGSRGRTSLLRDSNPGRSNQRRRISDVGVPGWRDRITTSSDQNSIPEINTDIDDRETSVLTKSSNVETSSAVRSSLNGGEGPTEPDNEYSMEGLDSAMSALTFVPLSVRMKSKKKF